jgi:hypothetical protein
MTRSQIKELRANGNSTFEVLQMVIDSGTEYPDAVFAVSQALRLDREERESMEADYDECA